MNFFEKNKKDILYSILTGLVFAFVLCGLAPSYVYPLNDTFFSYSFKIPMFVISLLLSGLFLFVLIRNKDVKINYTLIPILIVLFIVNLLGTLNTPNDLNGQITGSDGGLYNYALNISSTSKTIFILDNVLFLLFIYLVLVVFPAMLNRKFVRYVVLTAVRLFVIVALLYSLIVESHNIPDFFKHLKDDPYPYTFESFFGHRNGFGIFLLICTMIYLYFLISQKNKYFIVPICVLFIFLIFTFSKTSIIITFLLLLSAYIYLMIRGIRHSSKTGIKMAIVLSVLIVAGVIVTFVTPLKDIIYSLFVDKGKITLGTRADIWNKAFEYLLQEPGRLVFGVGFGNSHQIMYTLNSADLSCPINFGIDHAHNTFVELLFSGGMLYAICFVVLLVFAYKFSINKIRKENKDVGAFFVMVFTAGIVLSIFENAFPLC